MILVLFHAPLPILIVQNVIMRKMNTELNALYAKTISDYSISIDKLETLIGYDLFAALPDKVGKETADKIEAEDPHKSSWNWNL